MTRADSPARPSPAEPSRPLARQLEFRLPVADDWRVRVRAATAELAWLEEFLCPPFLAAGSDRGEPRVELAIDRTRFRRLKARPDWSDAELVPVFALDAGAVEMNALPSHDGGRLVRFEEFPLIYRIGPGLDRIELIGEVADPRLRTPVLRVVRELLMGRIFVRGWPLLHASAIESAGRAVAFLGPTSAGKTSLLLHALGVSGSRLLANDRLCARDLDGRLVVFPVPTIVTVRESGLEFFPRLRDRLAASRFGSRLSLAETRAAGAPASRAWANGKYGLTPAQLAALAGVDRAGHGTLTAIVVPRHTGGRHPVELRRLGGAEARDTLTRTQLAEGDWMRPAALFCPADAVESEALELREAQLDRLAAEVPVYTAELGVDAYQRPELAGWIAELLGRAP